MLQIRSCRILASGLRSTYRFAGPLDLLPNREENSRTMFHVVLSDKKIPKVLPVHFSPGANAHIPSDFKAKNRDIGCHTTRSKLMRAFLPLLILQ